MRIMTSVSILLRMIGAAIAVNVVKGFGMLALHHPHVGNGACDRGRRCRGWACEMGAGARPLPADEIAIGRRDRALTGGHGFAIGGQAHRASRLAPFEACIDEKLVESFGYGVPLEPSPNPARPRHARRGQPCGLVRPRRRTAG